MALAVSRAWRCGARCAWPALSVCATGRTSEHALTRRWLGVAPSSSAGTGGRSGIRTLATATGAAPSIPAALVKELRTRTGASMGKCRQALAEEAGDMDKAVDWLRKRGIRSMEKRTNETAESLLAICTDGVSAGAIVELSAETDFVIQNSLFQELTMAVACTAAKREADPAKKGAGLGEVPLAAASSHLSAKLSPGALVDVALLEVGSVLGERIALGRSQEVRMASSTGGVVAGYAHPKHAGAVLGTGRMAALVSLRPLPAGPDAADGLLRTASQLARHIVALQPRFVSVERVPVDVLEKERNTMKEAYMNELDDNRKSKLTDTMLTKVLDGKTQKFFTDAVLHRQELTIPNAASSDETESKPVSVEKWLKEEAKSMGLEAIEVEEFCLVCL